jgi:sirohydrochlorin ferrochelatase
MSDHGLLLIGHGSRSDESRSEMQAIGALVAAALPGVAVDVGFLEMTDPAAGQVLDGLAARGCRRVVVLPLVLLGAGHAKNDVPAVVVEGRARHPGLDVIFGSPLGIAHDLLGILGDAVLAAGGGGLPLLVIARGTSDPDANGDAHKVARLLAEWTGSAFVHTAFTGVTRPLVSEALEVFARLGHRRLAVAFWFLCTGVLVERARAEIAAFSARTGIGVVDAGYLGPDPRLVPVVTARYRESLEGAPSVNCDLCSYRAPWPGLDGRVGRPVGVGHSQLAADHRHRDGNGA